MSNEPAQHEDLGPFRLTTRVVPDETGPWLEAELTLSSGRLRVELDQADGNSRARARGRAIDAALQWLDKLLAEAIAGRTDEDQEE